MRIFSFSRKFFLRTLAVFAGILVLLAAVLIIISLAYGDKVKQLVVGEINSRLLVPVEVGKVEFTIFRSFPDASVVFGNVAMKPGKDLKEAPGLLHAESVSVRIGLFSLISGNYKIKSLIIKEASITLWVGPQGRDNYHIWKKSENTSTAAVNFDLQQVILSNTGFYYRNHINQTDLALGFTEFLVKGKLNSRQFDLQVSGDVEIKRLLLGKFNYTPASMLAVSAKIRVNDVAGICEVTEAEIGFAGVTAGIKGTFAYGKDENPVRIGFTTSKADISGILDALPVTLSEPYRQYEPAGYLTMKGEFGGSVGKRSSPLVKADFELADGSFTHRETNAKLRKIFLSGSYFPANGKKAEMLNLSAFRGETGNGKFKGSLKVINFKKPDIDLILSADLSLKELEGFIKSGSSGNLDGRIIADIKYRGAYKADEQMAVAANGLVSLRNVSFDFNNKGILIKDINGQCELKNGRIYVDKFGALVGETDIKLSGYSDNLISFLLFKDQPMHFNARFNSDNFRLEDIIALSGSRTGTAGQNSIFPAGLSFEAGFSIGKFSYKRFTAASATGNISLEDNVLRAGNLSFNALDGKITASGLLNGRYEDHAQVVCNATLTNVDIPRLFYEFNDFGQTSLQSKHMKGRGDARIQYASDLDRQFETDAMSVSAVADVEIRNGEMIDFEPFQEMSRFLDEDELRNVKFSTMRNRIEISRKTVIIPEMEIQTSALNVKGYGSHTFGNEIDYHFSVLTSELKKNKKRTPPATAIEDDGLGRTRLFLHMTGTVDDPVFKYDHRAVAKKIANDFKQEKQVFRDVIRKEFGKNKTTEQETKTKSSTQFEIEWDEDK